MDDVSVSLSRALNGIPLESAHFLIYCAAYKCLLPAVVIVASMQCKHSGTRRPIREKKQGYGRDDRDLAINSWGRQTGLDDISEFYVYTEMLVK